MKLPNWPTYADPVAAQPSVPVPPTPEMIKAFQQGFLAELHKNDRRRTMTAEEAGLRAMLAAAPTPPSGEQHAPVFVDTDDYRTAHVGGAQETVLYSDRQDPTQIALVPAEGHAHQDVDKDHAARFLYAHWAEEQSVNCNCLPCFNSLNDEAKQTWRDRAAQQEYDFMVKRIEAEMRPHASNYNNWPGWPGTKRFAEAAMRVFERQESQS